MSNEITNEQLEAWASLGPWLKQYSPTIDAMQIIEPVERDSEGNVPIPRKIAHVYEGQRMDMDRIKLHSDALAAAPDLARLVMEQDAKIERLRAALAEIFEMWAGSEGFIPETAPEGYLLMLVKKMADRAALAKMEESK